MKHAWRLVGRTAELEAVEAALADGRGVVFSGHAGVGKTRLLAESLALCERRGARALSIHASRSNPFQAQSRTRARPTGSEGPGSRRRSASRVSSIASRQRPSRCIQGMKSRRSRSNEEFR